MTIELSKLQHLIKPKTKRPETTLSLAQAIKEPIETVKNYIFTNSIRAYFNQVIEEVVADRGQGFWIQAEYGAGKTHFLATLVALLGENPELTKQIVWDAASDREIQNNGIKLQSKRLLPVVFSLRGEGGQGGSLERSLLDIIARESEKTWQVERQYNPSLPVLQLTTNDNLLKWYQDSQQGLRSDINQFVKNATGSTLADLRTEEGDSAAAELIVEYCQQQGIQPEVPISTKERARHIYQQVKNAGYTGILLVMDEFAFWQDREKTDAQRAADEETLETIGHSLPRDEGAKIWTIVASQKATPTKLKGDRFKELSLLADKNQTDYYTIASRRIRDVLPDREPEIDQYYDYYQNNFRFIKTNNISREQFLDCFPFQPRAFEIIKRITRENLPSARFGIAVLYDVLTQDNLKLLERNRLIVASDLLGSSDLSTGFKDSIYEDSYNAYLAARDSLKDLELEVEDVVIAQNILGFLFLEHLAYIDAGTEHWVKVLDIVEATLTQSDIINGADKIDLILDKLENLSQIEYEKKKQKTSERQSRFVSVKSDSFNPSNIFRRNRTKVTSDPSELLVVWRELLLASPGKTLGKDNLFGNFSLDKTKSSLVIHNHVEYKHEVVITDQWRSSSYGVQLNFDNHARIVFLTYSEDINQNDLEDPRIAVVVPAPLTHTAQDHLKNWLTIAQIETTYRSDQSADGERMREFLKEKRKDTIQEIQKNQVDAYRKGTVFTRKSLGIKLGDIFKHGSAVSLSALIDQAIASLAQKLLSDTYTQALINKSGFKGSQKFSQADVRRVFEGLFSHSPATAASRSAVDSYGVGLGLTQSTNTLVFAPENCPVFTIFREQLTKHQGKVTRNQLEKLLVGTEYGLTKDLLSLYLICFVHHGSPRCELELNADTTLRLRDGSTPAQQRVTADMIRQLDWHTKFNQEILGLQESQGVDWNIVVPFARLLDDNLTTTTDTQKQLEQQDRLLTRSIQTWKQKVETVSNGLESLAKSLGSIVPASVSAKLAPLQLITTTTKLDSFFETALELFGNEEQLIQVIADFKTLEDLSQYTYLGSEQAYLRQMNDSLPTNADALVSMLDSALAGFDLEQLIGSPIFQAKLKSQIDSLKTDYSNQYRIYHRDYHQTIQALKSDLADTEEKLQVLERLNSISELGLPIASKLRLQREALLKKLNICPVNDQELQSSLLHDPLCTSCRLELKSSIPTESVIIWRQELDGAIAEQIVRLKNETVKRLLRNSEVATVKQLLQVLDTNQTENLIDLITDEMTQQIQALFRQANVVSATSDVLVQIRESYSTIEREQLKDVLRTIELLLEAKFEEVEQANPGKNIRINLE
ncbi:MAG: hypothetical protein LH649_08965 [Pseudanabaena sp. CAN_BIN31]|nr:hypothetical protein [Pseudanabaena sp. CAN_BIN31]